MKKNLITAAATAGLVLTAFGASASAQESTYTVRPGDSLTKISHLNHISINHLKDWNHLSSDRIYVNQKLSITYTVKPGDSLWKLARTYGTTVTELKSMNGFTTDLIRIGQQLRIPETGSVSTTSNTYVVKNGDTLSEIGARFNLSVSVLKSTNQLTTDFIHVGQTLTVSGTQSSVAPVSTSAAEKSTVQSNSKVAGSSVVKPSSTAAKTFSAKLNSTTPENPAATSDASKVEKPVERTDSPETKSPVTNSNSTTTERPAVSSSSTTTERPAVSSNSTTTERPAASSNSIAPTKPVVKPNPEVVQKATENPASKVQAIIDEAKKYIGTPYRWGGNTPAGFDCSGFTKYVFNNEGMSLPRTTGTQWDATTPVDSPSIGDLVFFETYKVGPSHVGIYLGNNKFISSASQGVVISDMTSTYWKTRYLGARSPY